MDILKFGVILILEKLSTQQDTGTDRSLTWTFS